MQPVKCQSQALACSNDLVQNLLKMHHQLIRHKRIIPLCLEIL